MFVGTTTPRDKLDRLLVFARRALRYWWLVFLITIAGSALAVAFALTQKPVYQSETVLFHQERISSSVLQGRDVAVSSRNLGDRYRELLMARSQLSQVILEFDLFPDEVETQEDAEAAVDLLRPEIDFRSRGSGAFTIGYKNEDPALAQKVTARLTRMLIEEDARLRREQASMTREFLIQRKTEKEATLNEKERARARFLAEHPEFAEENSGTGAGVRAASRDTAAPPTSNSSDPQVLALERQRRRIQTRLEAPARSTPVPRAKTPEQLEAEREVQRMEREVETAQRELQSLETRFTSAHPDVKAANNRLQDAQRRLLRAQAAVPVVEDAPPLPPVDKSALREELREVERQLAAARARARAQTPDAPEPKQLPEEEDNWVVALETEWARLNRAVQEAEDDLARVEGPLRNAELAASSEFAEQSSTLQIIDPAHVPSQPLGKSPVILIAAGFLFFAGLGTALALGLALVDDRIYDRYDLEQLGVGPVLTVVPKNRRKGRRTT